MAENCSALRCATYKFSERTREQIKKIKEDRARIQNALFPCEIELTNTDVLRYLIEKECKAIDDRAAEAIAVEKQNEARKAKTERQRARRSNKKASKK